MLFLVDPIDEVAIQNLKSYKEKNFVDISKEDLDIGMHLNYSFYQNNLYAECIKASFFFMLPFDDLLCVYATLGKHSS